MPLDEGDVLNTLSDPVTGQLDFFVGAVHVTGRSFGIIRDHIRAGNIVVISGSKGLAFYDNKTDILTTEAGSSPANLDQRAQLLHECTHALVDIFYPDNSITRHIDELSAYITQFVYMMRSDPDFTVGPNNPPWYAFYKGVYDLIEHFGLDQVAGNGRHLTTGQLEPLRIMLAGLPGVNYGDFDKSALTGSNGLTKNNPFVDSHEEISVRFQSHARETYPDPTDDYLIDTLQKQYAANDVAGFGERLRSLRMDFAKCSLAKAKALSGRLFTRLRGDRVSELFYDRLSHGGRAILLRVLRIRTSLGN